MTMIAIPATRAHARSRARLHKDRLFYTGMAVAMMLTVFGGFAQTYYLKSYFGGAPLSLLVQVHGAVSTAWLLLFFTQTALVAARRTDIHSKLGLAGAVLAVFMVLVGIATAIAAFRGSRSTLIPLSIIGTFALFVGIGIFYRKQPETHKRLMLLATITMLSPATSRLPYIAESGLAVSFAIQDLFVLAGAVYDFASRRRVHPAYVWGSLLMLINQALLILIT
jgi:hypothetical protein